MLFYLRGRIFLTALPPTPPPQSGRGRLWGNRRFLPHLSEAAALPTATSFQQQPAPPNKKASWISSLPLHSQGGGVCGGTAGSYHIGAKRNSRPQAADFHRKSISPNKKSTLLGAFCLVGEDGFEPSKSVTTDLQSAPFGRSGILPYINPTEAGSFCGAGGRLRTPDLLITNQLLYLLSYTSLVSTNAILS